jgi:hypothetical protein
MMNVPFSFPPETPHLSKVSGQVDLSLPQYFIWPQFKHSVSSSSFWCTINSIYKKPLQSYVLSLIGNFSVNWIYIYIFDFLFRVTTNGAKRVKNITFICIRIIVS